MSALACPKRQRIRSGIKRKICASVLFTRCINRSNGAGNPPELLFDSDVWGKGGVRGRGRGREREGGRGEREALVIQMEI